METYVQENAGVVFVALKPWLTAEQTTHVQEALDAGEPSVAMLLDSDAFPHATDAVRLQVRRMVAESVGVDDVAYDDLVDEYQLQARTL
ncbi:hypothetical protein [Gulosibacter hominis]|uniref:hypothetical protein n=1 Tax=Gulosibacter hominis TaxID=2770504 RepID=UPI00191AC3AA|nr:hypothetical protein [Gulosibacter hominis]